MYTPVEGTQSVLLLAPGMYGNTFNSRRRPLCLIIQRCLTLPLLITLLYHLFGRDLYSQTLSLTKETSPRETRLKTPDSLLMKPTLCLLERIVPLDSCFSLYGVRTKHGTLEGVHVVRPEH